MFGDGRSVLREKKITQVTHTRVNRSHSDRRAVRIRTDRRRRSAESGCRRARGGVPAARSRVRGGDGGRERETATGGSETLRAAGTAVRAPRRFPRRRLRVHAQAVPVGPERAATPHPSGDGPGSADGGAPRRQTAVATATACTLSRTVVRARSCARVTGCRVASAGPPPPPPPRDRAIVGRRPSLSSSRRARRRKWIHYRDIIVPNTYGPRPARLRPKTIHSPN